MTDPARQLLERLQQADAIDSLTAYLRRQRWFGGRAREISRMSVRDAVPLRDREEMALWSILVDVSYSDGEANLYHLLLSRRPFPDAVATVEGDVRLAMVMAADDAPQAVCDAMFDPGALAALWEAIGAGEISAGAEGEVRCINLRLPRDTPIHAADIHPLAREQSNTSAVREERELLKCLRRVAPGVSPELELTDALARAGFERVAAPLGAVEYHPASGGDLTLLAVVQPFFHNATEGWTLALTSLRTLYADSEEMLLPDTPERRAATSPPTGSGPATAVRSEARAGVEIEQIGPEVAAFAPEAARLGKVTADMHLAAMRIGPQAELAPRHVTQQLLDTWAKEMTAELDSLLAGDHPALAQLRPQRPRIAAAFEAIRGLQGGTAIRVHGDYHLGQTLRTDDGWTIIDFEGEPNIPLAERRRHASALRDVAGMLRSFDYAAAAALAERFSPTDPAWPSLEPLGDAWAKADRAAFWEAYSRAVEGSGLLPEGDEALTLLRAFELRKAVYETGYELGHRSDWIGIPLRFLLAGGPP